MDLVGIPVTEHWPTMLRIGRKLEAAGYSSLWVYDHFHTVPEPTQEVTYEAWTLMAALAATTETIRIGQMCTCNSYRPPAYLAKMASSIDVISGGRLEFGIGAGWYEHEYLAYGYEFPKASVRIGQLREAVEIIKAMWTQPEATYEGRYYRVAGAINQPKSLQSPHPPMWIAGGDEKLTLRLEPSTPITPISPAIWRRSSASPRFFRPIARPSIATSPRSDAHCLQRSSSPPQKRRCETPLPGQLPSAVPTPKHTAAGSLPVLPTKSSPS